MLGRIAKKLNTKFLLLAAKPSHAFVDFNLTTGHGQTALCLAVEKGHSEVVGILSTRSDVDVNT